MNQRMNTIAIRFKWSFAIENCISTRGCWPNRRANCIFGVWNLRNQIKHVPLKTWIRLTKIATEKAQQPKMKLKLVFVDEEWIAMPCAQTHETSNYINSYALCVVDYFAKSFVYTILFAALLLLLPLLLFIFLGRSWMASREGTK